MLRVRLSAAVLLLFFFQAVAADTFVNSGDDSFVDRLHFHDSPNFPNLDLVDITFSGGASYADATVNEVQSFEIQYQISLNCSCLGSNFLGRFPDSYVSYATDAVPGATIEYGLFFVYGDDAVCSVPYGQRTDNLATWDPIPFSASTECLAKQLPNPIFPVSRLFEVERLQYLFDPNYKPKWPNDPFCLSCPPPGILKPKIDSIRKEVQVNLAESLPALQSEIKELEASLQKQIESGKF